jgi:SnoaL-like domain
MQRFRVAIQSGDIDTALNLLADDVVFRTPLVYRPYRGRRAVEPLLRAMTRVFDDFHYLPDIGRAHAPASAFRARIGSRELEGCDVLHVAGDGLIDELVVMVRPLSACLALADAMKAQLTVAA